MERTSASITAEKLTVATAGGTVIHVVILDNDISHQAMPHENKQMIVVQDANAKKSYPRIMVKAEGVDNSKGQEDGRWGWRWSGDYVGKKGKQARLEN